MRNKWEINEKQMRNKWETNKKQKFFFKIDKKKKVREGGLGGIQYPLGNEYPPGKNFPSFFKNNHFGLYFSWYLFPSLPDENKIIR
jgi:hypothetical protein